MAFCCCIFILAVSVSQTHFLWEPVVTCTNQYYTPPALYTILANCNWITHLSTKTVFFLSFPLFLPYTIRILRRFVFFFLWTPHPFAGTGTWLTIKKGTLLERNKEVSTERSPSGSDCGFVVCCKLRLTYLIAFGCLDLEDKNESVPCFLAQRKITLPTR